MKDKWEKKRKRNVNRYLRYHGVEKGSIMDQIANKTLTELDSDLISNSNTREIAGLVNLVTATMCYAGNMIPVRNMDARLKKEEEHNIKKISDFYSLPFEPIGQFEITLTNFISGLIRHMIETSNPLGQDYFINKYRQRLEYLYSGWKERYLNKPQHIKPK